MKESIINRLYEESEIINKDFLHESIKQYSIFEGIAEWYMHTRKFSINIPFQKDRNECVIIIENMATFDEINIKYIILVLNFLMTDAWWKRLPSAYNLKKLRKKDDNGVSLFDKLSLAYERFVSRKIEQFEKEEYEQQRVLKRFQ